MCDAVDGEFPKLHICYFYCSIWTDNALHANDRCRISAGEFVGLMDELLR